jgi:hypothetical protein
VQLGHALSPARQDVCGFEGDVQVQGRGLEVAPR